MMCKLKGGWIRVGIMWTSKVDAKGGIIMCKLKRWTDKGGHYDVQMKGWMQRIGHCDVQIKRADG